MANLKRTPLFSAYKKLGAKLIDFGGWELPVQFSGIKDEHLAVRKTAGIFDVSHMGEIRASGPGALEFMQKVTCNDASKIPVGGAQYSALLNEAGGFIDDIFIYRILEHEFFICVNAANAERDFEWLSQVPGEGFFVGAESSGWAQIAIQGPKAIEIFTAASENDGNAIPRNRIATARLGKVNVMAARTGYTGEDGLELFIEAPDAVEVWERLMEAGSIRGLVPVGLGARDTLRLEVGYPLHGHDITPETTPLEADLAWIVAMDKGDFIGKDALVKQREEGLSRKRIGFVMEDPGVPRDGYRILTEHGEGKVTSGTKTPSLDKPVGMGYVPIQDSKDGTPIRIEIRGKEKKARVKKWPFV